MFQLLELARIGIRLEICIRAWIVRAGIERREQETRKKPSVFDARAKKRWASREGRVGEFVDDGLGVHAATLVSRVDVLSVDCCRQFQLAP